MPFTNKVTVGELVEFLKSVPEDATINLEGCDCSEFCGGVSYDHQTGEVSMWRVEYVPDASDYDPRKDPKSQMYEEEKYGNNLR